jgi:hypothetical protein
MTAESSGFDSEDFKVSLRPLFPIIIQMHHSGTVVPFDPMKNWNVDKNYELRNENEESVNIRWTN